MKSRFIKTFFVSLFLVFFGVSSVSAQIDKLYMMEVGGQFGWNTYGGEVNTIARPDLFLKNLINVTPTTGLFLRYKPNTRMALRLGYEWTSVEGNYQYAEGNTVQNIKLVNYNVTTMGLVGEFNFFDLENNPFKPTSRKYSPFIFLGIGSASIPNSKKSNAISIPFGFGVKWKVAKRWNLNAQWSNHLIMADGLEGIRTFDNPAPKTIFNPFNNDLLSGIIVGLSFDFFEKPCWCRDENLFKKIFN